MQTCVMNYVWLLASLLNCIYVRTYWYSSMWCLLLSWDGLMFYIMDFLHDILVICITVISLHIFCCTSGFTYIEGDHTDPIFVQIWLVLALKEFKSICTNLGEQTLSPHSRHEMGGRALGPNRERVYVLQTEEELDNISGVPTQTLYSKLPSDLYRSPKVNIRPWSNSFATGGDSREVVGEEWKFCDS